MPLCNCQYMLLPFCPHGSGKIIARGLSSVAYARSVKNAGTSRRLIQNDAWRLGAIDTRITAAAIRFVIGRADDAENHIETITATTRNSYIMNRTGSAIERSGS